MKKIRKKPARSTRCKHGALKNIHKKPSCQSAGATKTAKHRAHKKAQHATQQKARQSNNVRARAKNAVKKGRPYSPSTDDAKLKKIAADVRCVGKKADAATATAERSERLCHFLHGRSANTEESVCKLALRQNDTELCVAGLKSDLQMAVAMWPACK